MGTKMRQFTKIKKKKKKEEKTIKMKDNHQKWIQKMEANLQSQTPSKYDNMDVVNLSGKLKLGRHASYVFTTEGLKIENQNKQ